MRHEIILLHGMGDSCYEPGFSSLTKQVSTLLGREYHVTCIPLGNNLVEDTISVRKIGYVLFSGLR